MKYTLQTEKITAVLDDRAVLHSFRNSGVPFDFIAPHGLWRMILGTERELEIEVLPENNVPQTEAGQEFIRYTYSELRSTDGRVFSVRLVITGRVAGDELCWEAEIADAPESPVSVREWMFPVFTFSPETEKMTYYGSGGGGTKIHDIRSFARGGFTEYMSWDNLYTRQIENYPFYMATNTVCFTSGAETLYFASHDPTMQKTAHVTELEKYTVLNQMIVKFPFLAPGHSVKMDGYVMAAIHGPWYRAAEKYRAWAQNWFKPKPHPERVDHSRGWQRLIARTQYGENLFPYHTFPQIFRDGIKAGIDTLFLFGWHQGGHDNDYPNYVPSEELGGEACLKENIRKFRELGGRVILYTNGQLIDTGSGFYKTVGHRISNKNAMGAEPQKFYGFSGRGIAQRVFGNRTFVTACFATKEWFDVLTGIADKAHEYGCDGVFFDQLGNESYACCDPTHGHPVPFMQSTVARAEVLRRLRDYIQEKYPEMSMGIEMLTDLTAQHVDYVHCGPPLALLRDPAWKEHGTKPELLADMDWARYIFPSIRISNREIREDDGLERIVSPAVAPMEFRVNFMLRKNLLCDVEIYRCKATIAAVPEYQAYLGKALAFRKEFAGLLDNAVFLSGSRHTCSNEEKVDSDGYLAPDGSIVVMVSQSASETETALISVPGMTLRRSRVLNSGSVSADGTVKLGMHALAVLVFA